MSFHPLLPAKNSIPSFVPFKTALINEGDKVLVSDFDIQMRQMFPKLDSQALCRVWVGKISKADRGRDFC